MPPVQWPISYLNVLNSARHFASMWHQNGGGNPFQRQFSPTKARFRFVDHHLAHALSAYSYSGFDDAAIVVMDGRGAWEATSIWHGRKAASTRSSRSIGLTRSGLFYAVFTGFLGFVPNSDEWKVMGLAPYGKPGVDLSMFLDVRTTPYKAHANLLHGTGSNPYAGWPKELGGPREPESEINDLHKDIAYAVQDLCETAMLNVVRLALQKTGSKTSLSRGRRGAQFESEWQNRCCRDRATIFSSSLPLPMMASRSAPRSLRSWMEGSACRSSPCVMLISALRSTTMPLKPRSTPTKSALRVFPIPLLLPPSFSRRAKYSAGIRAAWSLARVPWAAAPLLPIPAIRK